MQALKEFESMEYEIAVQCSLTSWSIYEGALWCEIIRVKVVLRRTVVNSLNPGVAVHCGERLSGLK